jgi:hypothetical protein
VAGDRFEVLESSVVKIHDDQEAVRFEPGEHTAANKAEQEALEELVARGMARKLRKGA